MVMVTDLELEPPLEAIAAGSWVRIPAEPLTVGVQVAVEVTCTLGLAAAVTTTALAVAQYCKPAAEFWAEQADDVLTAAAPAVAAEGNAKSLLVRSRLVTVTISRFAALLLLDNDEPPGL